MSRLTKIEELRKEREVAEKTLEKNMSAAEAKKVMSILLKQLREMDLRLQIVEKEVLPPDCFVPLDGATRI